MVALRRTVTEVQRWQLSLISATQDFITQDFITPHDTSLRMFYMRALAFQFVRC